MIKEEGKIQQVKSALRSALPFEPTGGQQVFIDQFSGFCIRPGNGIFILRGYAGTGKTTLMSAISSVFEKVVLLAPTGRAAKVLSGYTHKPAFTIHKHLYRPVSTSDGRMFLLTAPNRFKKTLFIVDEASMIPASAVDDQASSFPGVDLLSDLVNYVISGDECKLLLVGDTAQLPPVHFDKSPALDIQYMQEKFHSEVYETELKEVVRQASESGILKNATALRILISRNAKEPVMKSSGFDDVIRVSGNELEEILQDAYSEYGQENVLVITRSNKSAIQYNRLIRHRQLWMEDEVNAGDSLMVVKNNYHWLPDDHKAGFIANGDILEIKQVLKFREYFGFRYALAIVKFSDYPDEPDFEAWLMLDTISAEAPALTSVQNKQLYEAVMETYEKDEPDRKKRNAYIRKDPFYNALQVKFSYAVTCHKAQGGQWPVVFVDPGYLTDENMGVEFLRWLYTAFTRASKKLYLLNFNEKFFKD